mgnify:CR=1 FL=1
MDLEKMKSQYNNLSTENISNSSLIKMLKFNQQPAIKGIRKQMIIESVAWILFLAFYFNFFDGHLKPIGWNLILIFSVVLMLLHNMLSFQIATNPIKGDNLMVSMKFYLKRLRKYAYLSIASRIIALLALFGFFISGIDTIEQRHLISLFAVVIFVGLQGFLLWSIWQKRIKSITSKYHQLTQNL